MDSEIIFLAFLVLLSGIFSGAEIAFFSVSQAKVRSLVEQKHRGAKTLEEVKSKPQKLLATITISDNVTDIGASALATLVATERLGSIGAGVAVGVMTFLILFFGEIVPKSVAQRHSEKIALLAAPMAKWMMFILTPAVWFMNMLNNGFQRLLGIEQTSSAISEDEVRALLHLGHQEGAVEGNEKDMIEKVFLLNDIIVEDVMTPEEYIVGFDTDMTIAESLPIIEASGHSRFPVYTTHEVDVEGVVYLKDIFSFISSQQGMQNGGQAIDLGKEKIADLMKPAYFVPTTMLVDDLLREFQKRRVHIAIVVDEHGGVHGLVTLEDLLEEIVGEIIDETDVDSQLIEQMDDNTVLVDPRVTIGKLNAVCKSSIRGSRQKTVGWLVLKSFGRIPVKGDSVVINDYKFIIEEAEEHRIKRIQVIRTAKAKLQ